MFIDIELCWKLRVSYMRECQKMEIMQKTRTVSSGTILRNINMYALNNFG